LAVGASLFGDEQTPLEGEAGRNVGSSFGSSIVGFSPSSTSVLGRGRAAFPSLWPFGGSSPRRNNNGEEWDAGFESRSGDWDHFRGASANDEQSSDEDSDEEFGSDGRQAKESKRLNSTTEAKRRTSLEDDDEEEVVHVGIAEGHERGVGEKTGEGDDEELVEIRHTEMQGVEGVQK